MSLPIDMATESAEHRQLQENISSQKWDSALEVAFQLLESQPESSWLHTTMGKIYEQLHELTYAETSYKSAIYYNSQHTEAHIQLGNLYLKMRRIGSADDHCKQALTLDSSDLQGWVLYFHIKLLYSDISSALESYNTIKRLGATEELLSLLDFDLLRHPNYKKPVDSDIEINSRLKLLEKNPESHITHAHLAYLFNKFTNKPDLAEQHLKIAIQHLPSNPQVQEAAILIRRKHKLGVRLLTAPAQALTRPQQLSKNELAAVGITVIFLIALTALGSSHPSFIRYGIFSIITLFFCSYTSNQAFQYLTTTEVFHEAEKTSLIRGDYSHIHCLPYPKRRMLVITTTLLSWAALALCLYLLTR